MTPSTTHRAAPDRLQSLEELAQALRRFAAERDWKAYHTPKNLAAALIVEAAELLEHFQWLTAEESGQMGAESRAAVALEMADVLIYLTRLADRMGIDLLEAAGAKLALNAAKYPPLHPAPDHE